MGLGEGTDLLAHEEGHGRRDGERLLPEAGWDPDEFATCCVHGRPRAVCDSEFFEFQASSPMSVGYL